MQEIILWGLGVFCLNDYSLSTLSRWIEVFSKFVPPILVSVSLIYIFTHIYVIKPLYSSLKRQLLIYHFPLAAVSIS